jgi:hypothetical protein
MNDKLQKRIDAFIAGERSEKDTIAVKRIYVDMAGSLPGGMILGQIVYWHKGRLRVERDGELWLAKTHEAWWDEVRVTPKTAERAINKMVNDGFLEKRIFKFAGAPTVHIRIVWDKFLNLHNKLLSEMYGDPKDDMSNGIGQNVQNPEFRQNDQMDLDKMGKSLTETTVTETTATDITDNNNGFPFFDKLDNEMRALIPCPKCEKKILPERVDMNCAGH